MNIDEFLNMRGTDLPSVVSSVNATMDFGVEDVLLAVGSLAEGLGTSKSDLDLLFIGPSTDGAESTCLPEHVTLVVGKCLVDVRILRWLEFDALLTRFQTWARSAWNVTHAVKFGLDERTLLHRLIHSCVLRKGKREKITRRIPSRAQLARLKLHVARQMARTIQVDMIGYREVKDFRSLVFAAQEVLGHAVDALLAGYQFTNPLIKWRSRLLDFVPADWERRLAVRPTGLSAGERVWQLHRVPECADRELALEYAFKITTFARAVFMWAELQMVKPVAGKRELVLHPRPRRNAQDRPLPYLDFDVDFSLQDGVVTFARLNEFDEVLQISLRELALTLLFDGATSAREANLIVYGRRGSQAHASKVDRLISEFARVGFSVPLRTLRPLRRTFAKRGA